MYKIPKREETFKKVLLCDGVQFQRLIRNVTSPCYCIINTYIFCLYGRQRPKKLPVLCSKRRIGFKSLCLLTVKRLVTREQKFGKKQLIESDLEKGVIASSHPQEEWTYEKLKHVPWTFIGTSSSEPHGKVVLCSFNLGTTVVGDDEACIPVGMFQAWLFVVFLCEDIKIKHAMDHIDNKYKELNLEQENLNKMLLEIERSLDNEQEFIGLTIKGLNSSMTDLDQAIKNQEEARKKMEGQMNSIFNTSYAILLILVSVFLSVSINHIIYLLFRHREYHPL